MLAALVIGSITLLIFLALEGSKETNRYDEAPEPALKNNYTIMK